MSLALKRVDAANVFYTIGKMENSPVASSLRT